MFGGALAEDDLAVEDRGWGGAGAPRVQENAPRVRKVAPGTKGFAGYEKNGRATRAHVALRGRVGPPSQRTGPREDLGTGVSPWHRVPLGARREPGEHRESGWLRRRWRTLRCRSEIRRGGTLSSALRAAYPEGPLAHSLQPYAVAHVCIVGAWGYWRMNGGYREVKLEFLQR